MVFVVPGVEVCFAGYGQGRRRAVAGAVPDRSTMGCSWLLGLRSVLLDIARVGDMPLLGRCRAGRRMVWMVTMGWKDERGCANNFPGLGYRR